MKEAWLILLQPHREPVTRELTGNTKGKGDGDVQATSRWDKLVAEFHDIFNPPGMPMERDTVHKIKLLPNAEPDYRRLYRMSAAHSAGVRRQ